VGAGSAGCGIAEQIIVAMTEEGLSDAQARKRIYMIDRPGLLTDDLDGLYAFQSRLAHKRSEFEGWDGDVSGDKALLTVVDNAHPTVLIGVSGQRGLFSETVIKRMHSHCAAPFVMPLSNPTSRVEATPEEILTWTNGEGLVATGSPFKPVEINGRSIPIAQCNNAYIFPGVGLGVLASRATRVTDKMLMAASRALAESSPLAHSDEGALLPALSKVRELSQSIALAVGRQAQEEGVALASSDDALKVSIDRHFWYPRYRRYRRAAF